MDPPPPSPPAPPPPPALDEDGNAEVLRAVEDLLGSRDDLQVVKLVALARAGDVGAVRQQLAEMGPERVNDALANGWTALSTACAVGHTELVRWLLQDASPPADAFLRDEDGYSPLRIACQFKAPLELVELLLARGALDCEGAEVAAAAPGEFIITSLHLAAQCGSQHTVARLLRAGASPSWGVSAGITPLFLASAHGHAEVVPLLLAAADTAVAQQLLALRDPRFGFTPLMVAAQEGSVAPIAALLAAGAPVDGRAGTDDALCTPLFVAAQRGHIDAVRALVTAGADPSFSPIDGPTCVDVAREFGHNDVAEFLHAASASAASM